MNRHEVKAMILEAEESMLFIEPDQRAWVWTRVVAYLLVDVLAELEAR